MEAAIQPDTSIMEECREWIELSPTRLAAEWHSSFKDPYKEKDATDETDRWRPTINTLPDVMLLQIFQFLPSQSLGVAAQVSR